MTCHECAAPESETRPKPDRSAILDRTLLLRFANGDARAFETLWRRHEQRLLQLCLSKVNGRHADAEDSFGNARLNAFTKLGAYASSECNVAALLTTFVINACRDARRRIARETTPGVRLIEQKSAAATSTDSIDGLIDAEERAELERRAYRLSRKLQQVWVMRESLKMEIPEIAEALGITMHTVSQRLYRARRKLSEPERNDGEMAGQIGEVHLVLLTLASGSTMSCRVHLNKRLPHRPVHLLTLRKYVANHPNGWVKRVELANQLLLTGQVDEALAELYRVVEQRGHRRDIWLRIGEILRGQQRLKEARCAYEHALEHARSAADQQQVRGWIALCCGSVPRALSAFHRAAALEPVNPDHWHAIGFTARDAQRDIESAEAFERALALNPNDVVALTGSHDAMQHLERDAEIIPRLERAVSAAPNDVLALKLLAVHRTAHGLVWGAEGRRTLAMIRRATRLAPATSEAWEPLQHFHDARGDRAAAAAVWSRYLELHPGDARAWRLFAGQLGGSGLIDRAVAAGRRAMELAPDDHIAHHVNCCWILATCGELSEARAAFDTVIRRFPDCWEAWAGAGRNLAQNLGEPARGCRLARKATELAPTVAAAWREYGHTLLSAARFDEADAAWMRARELTAKPRHPGRTLELADAFNAAGIPGKGAAWLRRALADAGPWRAIDQARAAFVRARALGGLGDIAGAAGPLLGDLETAKTDSHPGAHGGKGPEAAG